MSDITAVKEEVISRLLPSQQHINVVFGGLSLRVQGREAIAKECPFCGKPDKFSISLTKPVYRCWSASCAASSGGDWFNYMELKRGLSFMEALSELARAAGIELQQVDWKQYQQKVDQRRKRAAILEQALWFFQEELFKPEGESVLQYLQKRGYSEDEIRGMDLGAYTSPERLQQHLQQAGYSSEDLKEVGLFTSGYGSTHTLAIPMRDASSSLACLAVRTILEEEQLPEGERKYKYSWDKNKERLKSQSLVGLDQWRGKTEAAVLVEGVLDAAYLSYLGLPTVANGGISISKEQIRALRLAGLKEIIIAYDNDESGNKGTYNAIDAILSHSDIIPSVARLNAYKDPDEYVREEGIERFKDLIDKLSEHWAKWRARYITDQHDVRTDIGIERAVRDALQEYALIEDPLSRGFFWKMLQARTGLSDEELEYRSQQYLQKASQKQTRSVIEAAQKDIDNRLKNGDLTGAEEALESAIQNIKKAKGTELPPIYDEEAFLLELTAASNGLSTGFKNLDKAGIIIPSGAITIIAARPGQGKTTTKLNLLLKLVQNYPEKRFYFFSYEEAKYRLFIKLLMAQAGETLHEKQNFQAYQNYLKHHRGESESIERAYSELVKYMETGRLQLIYKRYPAEELCSVIQRLSSVGETGSVFVDYIQKVGLEDASSYTRQHEIQKASELLRDVSATLDIPVIMGSQLNRTKGRGEKPSLDSLREADDIANDANLVLGLWTASEKKEGEEAVVEDSSSTLEELKIAVLKNRDGVEGAQASLIWKKPDFRLEDGSLKKRSKSILG